MKGETGGSVTTVAPTSLPRKLKKRSVGLLPTSTPGNVENYANFWFMFLAFTLVQQSQSDRVPRPLFLAVLLHTHLLAATSDQSFTIDENSWQTCVLIHDACYLSSMMSSRLFKIK